MPRLAKPRSAAALAALATVALLALAPPARAQDAAASVRSAITQGALPGRSHGDLARYRAALLRVYADGQPLVWTVGGRPTPQATTLIGLLQTAEARGLRARDYDGDSLAAGFAALDGASTAELARLDGWLSLSAMRLMDHMYRGRADPRALGFALPVEQKRIDLASLVRTAGAAGDPAQVVGALDPPFARFTALVELLARYRALAADTTLRAPAGRGTIRPGDPWTGARDLRRLLVALGHLAPGVAESDTFGGALVEGVKDLQRHRGLEADGVIGPATWAQLRVPLSARVAQIALTIERWRWLPRDARPRLAVVNIPGFRLLLFDRAVATDRPVERLDVIVGRSWGGRRTPVFAATMRYVIFQPFWDVPPRIARNEEVPHIRRDWSYADREGFEIVRGGDVGATVYAMTDANLDRVLGGSLRLRQRPGPRNALGAVKFVFPNPYNVYLHGTPAQSLFDYARRDFSHGCIRVSDPELLARFVLDGEPGWDDERIAMAMADGAPQLKVTLQRPIPVYVLYTTVVPDDNGVAYFYPDLYGHDATLARVLGLERQARTIALADGRRGRAAELLAWECRTGSLGLGAAGGGER